MKLKQAYFSAADESNFGVERIRPFDFWFEFIVDNKTITREDCYDSYCHYPSNWRRVKILERPIYIGNVNNFPQEAMSEGIRNIFSKITDYKKLITVVDNSVYAVRRW